MNYTVTLANGGTLKVTFANEVDLKPMGVQRTWLVDDNGVMLNMAHVATMSPEGAPGSMATDGVLRFRDGEGDMWTRAEDGKYALGDRVRAEGGHTFDNIEDV